MKPVFDTKSVTSQSDPTLVWEAVVNAAVKARVSDIHAMAQKDGLELAFRMDGDIRYQGLLPADFSRRLLGHVKTMAEIDLGENRRPTEGRMKVEVDKHIIDLRVSVVPTIYGQDLVVRVFDRTISLLDLHQLGLMDEQLNYLNDMIQRPHGLILVSGPTGSGKTTTLYAILRQLAGKGRKILTIENPVEYDMPSVNQTQVNLRIGVTYASLLTAILRQDPDIIMVGEVRDEETAHTSVRAANTGHLVLATTHATRASRAVETMLSLGVHPYFLAVALRGVVAQVLVKRICPHCRTALPETADMILDDEVRRRLPEGVPSQLFQGAGCDQCFGSGYAGRMGLFELFRPDDKIRQLILDRRPAMEIEQAAAEAKMISLEQAGKLAAVNGMTTMEELVDSLPMV